MEQQYLNLLKDILENGRKKTDRTGTGTISVFGRQLRHDFRNGFPLLTTKRMAFKTIVTELLWFLKGDTNIKYLVDNNCHIWDGDAYKNYCKNVVNMDPIKQLGHGGMIIGEGGGFVPFIQEEFINKIKTDGEFAKKWGDLGPIYGKQWRNWKKPISIGYTGSVSLNGGATTNNGPQIMYDTIDQISNLINDLKSNPDSRRLMVNAWNVGELDKMILPPCHYGFQVYTRELSISERKSIMYDHPKFGIDDIGIGKREEEDREHHELMDKKLCDSYNIPKRAISLMWNQRSVDTFLGLPFNIASYGLLLMMLAKEVNMVPDELIGNLGDCHLYSNHIEQAKEQLTRTPYELPKLYFEKTEDWGGESVEFGDFHPTQIELRDYQSHNTIKAPLSN